MNIPIHNSQVTSDSWEEQSIPIGEMVSVILKSWRFVVILAVAAAGIAILGGLLKTSYKSEGYFQVGLTFLEFKQLQSMFASPGRWTDFVKTLPSEEQERYAGMASIFFDQKQVVTFIEPLYPITKADLKEFAGNLGKDKDKDIPPNISGLKISFSAKTPEVAQRDVIVLGDYIRDTAILMNYQNIIHSRYIDYQNNNKKYENEIIDIKYRLEQLKVKKSDIQKILHNYPESAKIDTRQIVTLSEVSERYLSPITQLVAIESTISEQNRIINNVLRDQRINAIRLDYFGRAQLLLDRSTSGIAFIKALFALKDTLKLNMNDEVEKSAYNNLAIEILNEQFKFENFKFIAKPLLPNKRSPSLSNVALLGLILGGMLGCAYVLVRYFYFRKPKNG